MTSLVAPSQLTARISFAHVVVQHLAEECGVDVLHVKGVAIDPSLTTVRRVGTDADVLVRPSGIGALIERLLANGWSVHTTFTTGSPFEHATTLIHDLWGYADVHRLFPGINAPPEVAFDRLWVDRQPRVIAGHECGVPSLPAQTMILVLNAARPGGRGQGDVETAWDRASPTRRDAVLALVDELAASVAFAAGTGDLERFRGAPDYDLWRVTSEGGTRAEEWRARVRAAPSRRAALRLVLRATKVNTDHLEVILGRRPTRYDIIREFFARPARGIAEELRSWRRWAGRRRG